MITPQTLDSLRGKDILLFVADKDEIAQSETRFPVIYTGMGKMRMYSALVRWYETRDTRQRPIILNIGSAGSAKYPIGEVLNVRSFINGGSELIYDRIDLPEEGCSVFSGDYFMSTQTFNAEQVRELSAQYDLFDMEAYAAAHFCQEHQLPFYCFKAVSDNLDGTLKDWRSILGEIRKKYVQILQTL